VEQLSDLGVDRFNPTRRTFSDALIQTIHDAVGKMNDDATKPANRSCR